MRFVDRLDHWQREHPVLGFPLGVIYKFVDDSAGYLAALITYYAFVSLFPLLLLLSTILSWVLSNDAELQKWIIESALSQIPVVGRQLGDPKALSGGVSGVVIGLLVSLYGGLGVGNAVQYALNTIWTIPVNSRPNPFTARGRSFVLVFTAGFAVVATTTLSTLGALNVGWWGGWLPVAVTLIANTFIVLGVFWLGLSRRLPLRAHLPGAVLAAILWQLLQTFGVVYVGRVVNRASETNSVVGFVLGLVAYIYLVVVAFVLSAELNVTRVRRLWPRALLTPFTDDVDLTPGDVLAYGDQARAQRAKGFETIEVRFRRPPTYGA